MGMSPSADPQAGEGSRPPDWQQVQTLGVAEVVMAILAARKTMPSATAAAVSRERHGKGFQVRVRLIEDIESSEGNTEGPDGAEGAVAIFIARVLGQDLVDAFGDRDVIILK
jgi:hypothetical protein